MEALQITLVPNAKQEYVSPRGDNSFIIHVTQPAFKGKANKAMLKILAKHLHVRQSDLILSKGERTNLKTVLLIT
jgi:uncharacterized protein YggU (UPF0235/DUF167 family)